MFSLSIDFLPLFLGFISLVVLMTFILELILVLLIVLIWAKPMIENLKNEIEKELE